MAAEVKAGEKLPTASFIPVSGMKNIYQRDGTLSFLYIQLIMKYAA